MIGYYRRNEDIEREVEFKWKDGYSEWEIADEMDLEVQDVANILAERIEDYQ